MAPRRNSRQRILDAATELAQKQGSAHLSLDAVAALAGISKGGLLYNFPNKTALLTALVEQFVDRLNESLDENVQRDGGHSVPLGYFELALEEINRSIPPPSGILAALSENPDLLAPIRDYNRQLLDRIKAGDGDEISFFVAFLALEGMRSHRLFEINAFTDGETEQILARLKAIINQA